MSARMKNYFRTGFKFAASGWLPIKYYTVSPVDDIFFWMLQRNYLNTIVHQLIGGNMYIFAKLGLPSVSIVVPSDVVYRIFEQNR